MTPVESIRFYRGMYGLSWVDSRSHTQGALLTLELEAVKDNPVKSLPPGWKQKLAFSIAMLHKPAIIFLNEPTGGVDPITRRQFWNMIYQAADQGVTIFITTHYMDEAEYCHRISIMMDGRIEALDTPKNIKTKYEAADLTKYF